MLDSRIEDKIQKTVKTKLRELNNSVGYDQNDYETHTETIITEVVKVHQSIISDGTYRREKGNMSNESIEIIDDIRNIMKNPDIIFIDTAAKAVVNNDLFYVIEIIRVVVESSKREAEKYMRSASARNDREAFRKEISELNDRIQNMTSSPVQKKSYSAGVLITRDFKTSGNMMAIREVDQLADKKYDDLCDTERNIGGIVFALGTIATLATGGAAAPIIVAGLGAGAVGHGYAAKRVGRTGKYVDLVYMATGSLGHVGQEMANELSGTIDDLIFYNLRRGVKYGDGYIDKRKIINLIDSFLSGSSIESTGVEDFDDGIQNIIYILQDLDSIYRAKENAIKNRSEVDISRCRFNILKEKKYTELFASMSLDKQRLIIDSVKQTIIESLVIVKDVVENNRSTNTLKIELNRARTESCAIL